MRTSNLNNLQKILNGISAKFTKLKPKELIKRNQQRIDLLFGEKD